MNAVALSIIVFCFGMAIATALWTVPLYISALLMFYVVYLIFHVNGRS